MSRLESMVDVPMGPRQYRNRQVAYVLCHAYRVDPAEFGLDDGDRPPGVTITPRSEDGASTIWYSDTVAMTLAVAS